MAAFSGEILALGTFTYDAAAEMLERWFRGQRKLLPSHIRDRLVETSEGDPLLLAMIIQDVDRYGLEVLEQLPLSLDDRITKIYRQLVNGGVPSELICNIANRTTAAEPADWNEIRRHWRDVGSTVLPALERSGLFVVDRVSETIQVSVVHARIAEVLKDICRTD